MNNLFVAFAVASFAIAVLFRVRDKLTTGTDEKAGLSEQRREWRRPLLNSHRRLGARGGGRVTGIGSGVSLFLGAVVDAVRDA